MLDDRETAETFDLIVVGSGAAGMAAALTAAHHGLSAVIVEKARHWGGSTARSGGGVWIPGNSVLRRDAPADDLEAARTYLEDIIGPGVDPALIDTYLDRGAEAFDFMTEHSPLRMRWVPGYSDYYPEAPGGRAHGRSIEPVPFNANVLGAEAAALEPDYVRAPKNVVITQAEFRHLNLGLRTVRGPLAVLGIAGRWLAATVLRRRVLVRGQALSAMLRAGLQSANVPLWLETPLIELCTEGGRVTGVVVQRDGREQVIVARRGVVIAAGGFEHNEVMRKQFQREPIGTDWTVGVRANTGDGIRAGQTVGGAVGFMDDAWWGPSIPLPSKAWFCLAERNLPGSLVVNDRGERFMNECLPYVEAVHSMYGGTHGQGEGPGENLPAWLIFDQRYRNRYQFAGIAPRQALPGRWYKSGALTKADSLPELAEQIGLPVEKLTATVTRFNEFAHDGKDPDFGRGDSAYDNYYGDPRNHPNPNLGALEAGPFYAAKLVPGDLGTKGGLTTDVDARVRRADGSVIDGLYAAGNSAAPVMGHTYAGPGATIGPALVFGYLAARHAAL
ncbi:3-oxosteroid 1-dehydrogenase [Nocardia sp. NPDC059240]|uniref:3-oxosteroid 1-dehydrogenase n=1 Tax=Nocardia sp. NPDC059240 TaxID=3346786 RepID=UPI0036BFC194